MRLLSLDYEPVYGDDAEISTFSSDVSVFDFDVVIWDPAASLERFTRYATENYLSLPCLGDDGSIRIQADAIRRRAEFKEFTESGRSLVVIVRPPMECYVATGQKTYSGTGRNRHTTRVVDKFDILSAIPVEPPGFVNASGKRISVVGDSWLAKLLRDFKESYAYSAVMSAPPGQVVARVVNTERCVSSLLSTKSGGSLVMMPALDFEAEYDEEDESPDEEEIWTEAALQFQEKLLEALAQQGSGTVVRPSWSDRYSTQEQIRLKSELVKQQARVEAARRKVSRLQQEKEAADAQDQLFLGSGRALELEVRAVLELMGGVVADSEPGRDDWTVTFPEGKAVVEVKGVNKSAAEKHAAQLEKWVASAFEETGEQPKGILVVNTWRELPLVERLDTDFPDQMLPYCQGRGHCLLTGLQLYLIRQEIKADPTRAEHWRQQLLRTSGRLETASNWRDYIEESKPATDNNP